MITDLLADHVGYVAAVLFMLVSSAALVLWVVRGR